MAILKPNPLIGALEGAVGDLVFAKTKDGRVRVQHRPIRKAPFRSGELLRQACIRGGNEYVARVRRQPDQYAVYQNAARITGKRACDLARSDFLCPPAVGDIDVSGYNGTPGQSIAVQATDDFGVVSVSVVISDVAGVVIEQGPAELDETTDRWRYTTTVPVATGQTIVVHVSAADRPGNVVTKAVDHALLAAR